MPRIAPFPYFGSKARPALLEAILPNIRGNLLYEPFAGSLAVSAAWCQAAPGRRWLATDIAPEVVRAHCWLAQQTPESIEALASVCCSLAKGWKISELAKSEGERDYLAFAAGPVKGVYRPNGEVKGLPGWRSTVRALPMYRCGEVVLAPAAPVRDAYAFVDPPYRGSSGGYDCSADVSDLVRGLVAGSAGAVVSYGGDAAEVWPEWNWRAVYRRKTAVHDAEGHARVEMVAVVGDRAQLDLFGGGG